MRAEVRAGRRGGVERWRRERHALGRSDSRLGGQARAKRTANMAYMVMTLDVSKFSGWLNDVALCRIEGTAYARFRAGRRKGLGWWRHRSGMHMHGKRARLKAGAPGHVRSARRT
jgi:hypothetical protein